MVFELLGVDIVELFEFFKTLGYPGAFLVSLIGSASVFIPIFFAPVIFGLGTVLDPLLLTIVAGIGAAVGELSGFYAGKLGHKIITKKRKHGPWMKKAEGWFKQKKGFAALVFFAAGPVPTDIGGFLAGSLEYDFKKFMLAMLIGKLIKMGILAYGGFYSSEIVRAYFGI